MKPRSPALQADSPPAEPTREALSVRIVDFFQCFKNSTNLEGKCINKPIPDNLVTQSHLLLDSYLRVECINFFCRTTRLVGSLFPHLALSNESTES